MVSEYTLPVILKIKVFINKAYLKSSTANDDVPKMDFFRVTGPLWGESPVNGGFPSQRPVTRGFDIFFDLCLTKQASKQPRRRWFETQSRSLWRDCNWNMLGNMFAFIFSTAPTAGVGQSFAKTSATAMMAMFVDSLALLTTKIFVDRDIPKIDIGYRFSVGTAIEGLDYSNWREPNLWYILYMKRRKMTYNISRIFNLYSLIRSSGGKIACMYA